MSVDEGVSGVIPEESDTVSATVTASMKPAGTSATGEEMSGQQLMERLHTLAAKSAEFEERRHKFQKRQREDWRTRTQPVTLEEIQQADRCGPVVVNPCLYWSSLPLSLSLSAFLPLSVCLLPCLLPCVSVCLCSICSLFVTVIRNTKGTTNKLITKTYCESV